MKSLPISGTAALALALSISMTSMAQDHQGQVTNYTTPGNLQSNHPLDCISSGELRNIYTPADLYPALAKCLGADRYKDAILLYSLTAAYSKFDSLRVADTTAHQAVFALQAQNLGTLPDAKNDRMRDELKSAHADPRQWGAICARIREVGPPNYHPDYMIQHGMNAFTGIKGDGLVPDFDAKAGWETSLETYLHCPAVPVGGTPASASGNGKQG